MDEIFSGILIGILPVLSIIVFWAICAACNYVYVRVLRRYRKWQFKRMMQRHEVAPIDRVTNQECPICLEDVVAGDVLIVLKCNHAYHPQCLGPWVHYSGTCPMCKRQFISLAPATTL